MVVVLRHVVCSIECYPEYQGKSHELKRRCKRSSQCTCPKHHSRCNPLHPQEQELALVLVSVLVAMESVVLELDEVGQLGWR